VPGNSTSFLVLVDAFDVGQLLSVPHESALGTPDIEHFFPGLKPIQSKQPIVSNDALRPVDRRVFQGPETIVEGRFAGQAARVEEPVSAVLAQI